MSREGKLGQLNPGPVTGQRQVRHRNSPTQLPFTLNSRTQHLGSRRRDEPALPDAEAWDKTSDSAAAGSGWLHHRPEPVRRPSTTVPLQQSKEPVHDIATDPIWQVSTPVGALKAFSTDGK